ncbi:hypothetical protein EYF80_004451 [Liparis tanakae]|uniref:Uncharacterized protein n=1 Tax=Liparis tanakae TaxID=230148 RepID=A0A4Z2J5E5_9TELE|nr:hypothetical protein EYF80_004451 [Liparis tanakae]
MRQPTRSLLAVRVGRDHSGMDLIKETNSASVSQHTLVSVVHIAAGSESKSQLNGDLMVREQSDSLCNQIDCCHGEEWMRTCWY